MKIPNQRNMKNLVVGTLNEKYYWPETYTVLTTSKEELNKAGYKNEDEFLKFLETQNSSDIIAFDNAKNRNIHKKDIHLVETGGFFLGI